VTELCNLESAARRGGVGRVAGSGMWWDQRGDPDELVSVQWKRAASLSVLQSDSYHQYTGRPVDHQPFSGLAD
jgi:hypothetical protein